MELTKKQSEAVNSTSQSTLVIAGPGTGKTHIIASRVEFLVKKQKIDPENILCLTYTSAGATTMQKRIIQFLGEAGTKVTASTFHAFASSLIQEHPNTFGYRSNVQPATEIDQVLTIKKIIDNLYKNGKLKNLSTANDPYYHTHAIKKNINTLKSEGFSPEEYINIVNNWQKTFDSIPLEEKMSKHKARQGRMKNDYEKENRKIKQNKEFAIIYQQYQQELQKSNLYDYSDMINGAILGLEKNEDIKQEIQEKYSAILVDEYQDTNGSQNKLLFNLLDKEDYSCFVVGDDDQAINRFQGATIENFTELKNKFKKTKVISLEDNFRSPQQIIDSALNLIQENSTRISNKIDIPPKKLIAKGKTANNKEYFIEQFETDIEEKAFIVDKILELKNKKIPLKEIAILTKENKEQEYIASSLYAHDIPYTISGKKNALEQNVVISFLKILQCCQNPNNSECLEHFLIHATSPITAEDTLTVFANRKKNKSPLYKELKNIIPKLKYKEKAQETLDIIHDLYQKQSSNSALSYLHIVAQETGYINWILSQENKIELLNNLSTIYEETKRFQKINPRISIKQLIKHFESFYQLSVQLDSSTQAIIKEDSINILTAHQSKGREFDYVFIVNNIQGVWADKKNFNKGFALHSSIKTQETDKEDERRLFFVALTRAKKGLFILYPKKLTEGLEKHKETISSEFLESLNKNLPQSPYKIKSMEHFIEKMFTQTPETNYSPDIKNTIKEITESPSFNLSATSLNRFLECPNEFLYSDILKVPSSSSTNPSLVYGNAIHHGLQKYFEKEKEKRSFQYFIETIEHYIETESMLTEKENYYIIERAKEKMKAYYEQKLCKEKDPLYTEKNITIKYKNIPLTGKIDKVSKIQDNEIAIIDYKSSKEHKTKNAILGGTKDKDGPKIHNQLMFYKLLATKEKDLAQYKASKFSVDFVEKIYEAEIEIENNDEQYINFLQQVEDIWSSIQQLSFLESTEQFPFCGKCQYCQNIKNKN